MFNLSICSGDGCQAISPGEPQDIAAQGQAYPNMMRAAAITSCAQSETCVAATLRAALPEGRIGVGPLFRGPFPDEASLFPSAEFR